MASTAAPNQVLNQARFSLRTMVDSVFTCTGGRQAPGFSQGSS